MTTSQQLHLLALCRIKDLDWTLLAREAQRPEGLERLLAGEITETTPAGAQNALALRSGLPDLERLLAEAETQVEKARINGANLVTVLDPGYPLNLREIANLPPFLFFRGHLQADDTLAVAVIGTRNASEEGLRRARKMAGLLASRGVTVLSGLARGIDTAAHEAALAAQGRTVAVMGTGILRIYPSENADLAQTIIAAGGTLVSQFWPDQHPARYTFPKRNVVMSGLSQGSVVIEASSTSGAKMQARLALEHGRRVFLLRSLVEEHEWARKYRDRRGAVVVESVEDVLAWLDRPVTPTMPVDKPQLRLAI